MRSATRRRSASRESSGTSTASRSTASSMRAATWPFGAIPRQSASSSAAKASPADGGRPRLEREEVVPVRPRRRSRPASARGRLPRWCARGGRGRLPSCTSDRAALLLRGHAREALLEELVEVGVEVVHLPRAHGDRDRAEGPGRGLGEAQARAGAGDEGVVLAQGHPSGRQLDDEAGLRVLDAAVGEGVALDRGDRPPLREVRAQHRPQAGEDPHHDGDPHEAEHEVARPRPAARPASGRRAAGDAGALPSKAGVRIEGRVSGRSSSAAGAGALARARGGRAGRGRRPRRRRATAAGGGRGERLLAATSTRARPRARRASPRAGGPRGSTPRASRDRPGRTPSRPAGGARYWLAMDQCTQMRS